MKSFHTNSVVKSSFGPSTEKPSRNTKGPESLESDGLKLNQDKTQSKGSSYE